MSLTLLEQKARGQAAESLLENELLNEALLEIRHAAHRAFEKARGDEELLWRASAQLEASKQFHLFFLLLVKQGKAAAKQIDRELNKGQFVRGIGRLVRDRDPLADEMPWSQTG